MTDEKQQKKQQKAPREKAEISAARVSVRSQTDCSLLDTTAIPSGPKPIQARARPVAEA